MNKKKYIKKIFSQQIAGGFQFKYVKQDNTIEKYCLEKDSICICFIEDYRHEWLSVNVIWDKHVNLVSVDGITCCSKIMCKNSKEMEEKLKKIFSSLVGDVMRTLSDKQYCEIINIYYDFLEYNNFFENIVI